MLTRKPVIRMLLSFVLGIITFSHQSVFANADIVLYTTNTKVSIPPGESVSYNIDVINNSQETQRCDIRMSGIPRSWNYTLSSGAYNVQQISILPGEKKTLSLKIDIPFKVNKGNYPIKVNAGTSTLPLVLNVSTQGNYRTEFTTDQANMVGHSKASFTFRADLKNQTGEKQLYALQSKIQKGWQVIFKSAGQQATSTEIEPNSSKVINIEIKAPQNVAAGTYKIPLYATNNLTSAELELEIVISGTYEIALTTPTGLVSTKTTAGDEKKLDLVVSNTGSVALSDVSVNAVRPSGWEVNFEPANIARIEPGNNIPVIATIKADKKAIAGDYVSNITARSPDASSSLAFRISVKTPMIWGWVGILIILLSVGCIIYLFRKYGRR